MNQSFIENKKKELLPLVKQSAKFGEFILASGKKSDFYFDGRLVSCSAKGSLLIAEIILDIIKDLDVQSIGGLTLGADPIVAAVACQSAKTNFAIDSFIVRKEAKEHGTKRQIEGCITKNSKVVIVDDVVTTASSTLQAIKAVETIGCQVKKVICLLDRLEGGLKNLANYDFYSIFTKKDLQ